MRRGGSVLILLGIILGLVTAAGTFLVLSTSQPQVEQVRTRQVVIALQNIPARSEIRPEALGTQAWPEPIPTGATDRIDDVVGKLATVPIYQGEVILPQMFIDKAAAGGAGSNASYVIPDGKVAVAFPISPLSSVANAIQVGDTVDIMLTLNPGGLPNTGQASTGPTVGTEGQAVSQLMLQDVLILQVGPWTSGTSNQNSGAAGDIVTFALDRQDALALKSAREQGTIEFALRPAGDHKAVTTEPVTLQYLNKRFNFNLLPSR